MIVPKALRDLDQWVIHKAKRPYNARTGKPASSTNPSTWCSRKRAEKALRGGHWDGVGFVFSPDTPVMGVDIDHCIEDGVVAPWAREIIDSLDSYAEISPSGTGVHVLVKGPQLNQGYKKEYEGGHVEVYSSGRYFTVTGDHLGGTPDTINDATMAVKSLLLLIGAKDSPAPPSAPGAGAPSAHLPPTTADLPEALAEVLLGEPDFCELFFLLRGFAKDDGTPDASSYDQGLANWCVNAGMDDADTALILRTFRKKHNLNPEKADRPDYIARTIAKAREDCTAPEEEGDQENTLPQASNGQQKLPESLQTPDALTEAQTRVAGRLLLEPPEPDYLLDGLLVKGTVGAVVAMGGMGKTYFLLQLAHTLASAGSLGPFRATGHIKTLLLAAEDPQDVLDRRMWPLGQGEYPEALHVASVTGKVGPLIELKGKVAKPTKWYRWLRATIEAHPGLEVLILDPMSRFSGLEENDNNQATRWVAMLEKLVQDYGITILFSHHVAKMRADEMSQAMARGASSLIDGCRWAAGLTQLNDKDATKFEVVNPREYTVLDVVKSNYAAKLPAPIHFKRGPGGILEPVELRAERQAALLDAVVQVILGNGAHLTRREITRGHQGKFLRNALMDQFGSVPRQTLEAAIDEGLRSGVLESVDVCIEGGGKRSEITVSEVPF